MIYAAPLLCLLLNFLARGVLSIVETDGPYTCQETSVIHLHNHTTTKTPPLSSSSSSSLFQNSPYIPSYAPSTSSTFSSFNNMLSVAATGKMIVTSSPIVSSVEAIAECANYFTLLGVIGLVVYIGIDYIPKRWISGMMTSSND